MTLNIPMKECMKMIGLLGQHLDQVDCGDCPRIDHAVCPNGDGEVNMYVSYFPVYLVPKSEPDAAETPVVAITTGATGAPAPAPTAVPTLAPTAAPAAAQALPLDAVRFLKSE